jgi:hypothetical protein
VVKYISKKVKRGINMREKNNLKLKKELKEILDKRNIKDIKDIKININKITFLYKNIKS